jgi:hypothetical protein
VSRYEGNLILTGSLSCSFQVSLSKPALDQASFSYAPLGRLILLQVLTTGGIWLYSQWNSMQALNRNESDPTSEFKSEMSPGGKHGMEALGYLPTQGECVLCLEPRKVTTVAVCGHLFCWTCIGDWLREKVREENLFFAGEASLEGERKLILGLMHFPCYFFCVCCTWDSHFGCCYF